MALTEDSGWSAIPRSLLYDPDCSVHAKMVYLALSSHINGRTGLCVPKQTEIARYLGIGLATVKRSLTYLREQGYIEWEHRDRDDGSGRTSNSYRLILGAGPVTPAQASKHTLAHTEPPESPVAHPEPPASSHRAGGVAHTELPITRRRKNEKKTTTSSSGTAPRTVEKGRKEGIDDQPAPDVVRLCELLADQVAHNGNRRPTVTKVWYRECRLLIQDLGTKVQDGPRTRAEAVKWVEYVIRWSQADTFWRSNVMSMPKLREKFDVLRQRSRRPTGGARSTADRTAQARSVIAKLEAAEAAAPRATASHLAVVPNQEALL